MGYYGQWVAEENEWMGQVIDEVENLKSRMKLEECKVVVIRYDVFVGWFNGVERTVKHVQEIVEKEASDNTAGDRLFLVSNFEELIREEYQGGQLADQVAIDNDNNKQIYKSLTAYFV